MSARSVSPKFWSGLSNDLSFAARQTRKRPLFSLSCIAVLALGLGATTAIFAVLYAAVLQPLPFPHPDELVAVHNRFPLLNLPRLNASSLDYLDLRQHHELFADAGGYYYLDLNRTGIDIPVKVNAIAATTSLFHTLGVKLLFGRLFDDEEQRYHGPRAVILSEAYWRTEFGADPKILTRSLLLNGESYPVVGVMPRSFQVPNEVTQMWTPLTFSPGALAPAARQNHYVTMYARLASGLTFADAAARIEQLSRSMSLQHPEDYPLHRLGWRFFLQPLAQDNDGSERTWLFTLFAAVTCLLLIVATNVAGLLAVRSTERQVEVAIRLALGANRFRIARQVLVEVLLLAFCAGIAGWFIAYQALKLLDRYGQLPGTTPHLTGPVFLFGSLLCLLAGITCSVFPAFTASFSDSEHQRTASAQKSRLRQALLIGQVAIATTLLLAGCLLIRNLIQLIQTPPGFDAHNILTAEISLPAKRYLNRESRLHLFETTLRTLQHTPGIEAASGCTLLPFGWGNTANTFEILGRPKPHVEPYANINLIFPDYYSALRIPFLRGRNFNDTDRGSSQRVALIDQAMVDRYFAHQDPIGQSVRLSRDDTFRIIGVVGRVKSSALDAESRPTLYFSARQVVPTDLTILIRSSLPQGVLETTVRRAVAQVDRDQPVYDFIPLSTFIEKSFRTRRFVVWLITLFAALGTLLAAIGLYSLLSYTILLRRREMGIRMALGATRHDIASLVARIGFQPVAIGIAAGCFAAIALGRYFATQLVPFNPWDPISWITVLLAIIFACAAACALPMWRAAKAEPLTALRDE